MTDETTTPTREMTATELIDRAIAEVDAALDATASAPIVQDLTLAQRRIPTGATPSGAVVARCPVCGSAAIARLVDDWSGDHAIPIVGCGNPWHYATRSLDDDPDVEAATEPLRRSAVPTEAIVDVAPGEPVAVQIVDPAPGQNRVVVHRRERELGHRPDGREFLSSVCMRCGLLIAYAVRDQVVCGGLAGVRPAVR